MGFIGSGTRREQIGYKFTRCACIVMKGEPCKTAMQGGEFLFEQIFCFQKAFEFFLLTFVLVSCAAKNFIPTPIGE